MTQELKDRFFYRRTDDDAPSSAEVERVLRGHSGLVVLDVRPRMILVEQERSGARPVISGWSDFSVQRYEQPNPRPRVRK